MKNLFRVFAVILLMAPTFAFGKQTKVNATIANGDFEGRWINLFSHLWDSGAVKYDSDGNYEIVPSAHVAFTGDLYDRGPYSMRGIYQINKMYKLGRASKVAGNRDINKIRFLYELFDEINATNGEGGPYYKLTINNGVGFRRLPFARGRSEIEYNFEKLDQEETNSKIMSWLTSRLETSKKNDGDPSIVERFLDSVKRDVSSGRIKVEDLRSDPVIRLIFFFEKDMNAANAFNFRAEEMAAIKAGVVTAADVNKFADINQTNSRKWREDRRAEIASYKSKIDPGEVLLSILQDMVLNVKVEKKTRDGLRAFSERPELARYKGILAEYLLNQGNVIDMVVPTNSILIHGDITEEVASAVSEGWLPKFGGHRYVLEHLADEVAKVRGRKTPKDLDSDPEFRNEYLSEARNIFGEIDEEIRSAKDINKGKIYLRKMNENFRKAISAALNGTDPADGLGAWYNHVHCLFSQKLSFSVARSTDSDGIPFKLKPSVVNFVRKTFGADIIIAGHTPDLVPIMLSTDEELGNNPDGVVGSGSHSQNQVSGSNPSRVIRVDADTSYSDIRCLIFVLPGGRVKVQYKTKSTTGEILTWVASSENVEFDLIGKPFIFNADGVERKGIVAAISNDKSNPVALIFSVDKKNGFSNSAYIAELLSVEKNSKGSLISMKEPIKIDQTLNPHDHE